ARHYRTPDKCGNARLLDYGRKLMAPDHEVPIVDDVNVGDVSFSTGPKQVQGLPLVRADAGDYSRCTFNGREHRSVIVYICFELVCPCFERVEGCRLWMPRGDNDF